jgi:hypothetical protein
MHDLKAQIAVIEPVGLAGVVVQARVNAEASLLSLGDESGELALRMLRALERMAGMAPDLVLESFRSSDHDQA